MLNEFDQYLLDFHDQERPSLDNFVVGHNAEAVRLLREIKAGRGPMFVYLYGPKGAGITHLLKSLVPEQSLRVPIFQEQQCLYVVDDVDELDPGWALQLLALQNAVRNAPGSHLVCGGKAPAHQLEQLPEVVRSRLGWGVSYAISPLSETARFEELSRQAKNRGFELTTEMQHWMSVSLPRDMRTLTRVLEEVDRLALVKQRRVTLPLLREAVSLLEEQSKAQGLEK